MVMRRMKYPGTRGLCLRKTEKSAVTNLRDEFKKVMRMLGCSYKFNTTTGIFTLPGAAEIFLAYCANEKSYESYQGVQYTDIWWEEAAQHAKRSMDLVNGSCRTDFPGCKAKVVLTANPGGPGHQYILEDFVDERTRKPGHVWIQALLKNALFTLQNDPGYRDRVLAGLPEHKRKQWEDGDWWAMAGQYFEPPPSCFSEHKVPYYAKWYGGVDYGYRAATAVLWLATWTERGSGKFRVHVVKEIYARKLHLDDQAALAKQYEAKMRDDPAYNITGDIIYFGDPAILQTRPASSYEVDFNVQRAWLRNGWVVRPAKPGSRVANWDIIRLLMNTGALTISPTGCPALEREIRAAVYDDPDSEKCEDISQDCADHALTALSYAMRHVYIVGAGTISRTDPWAQGNEGYRRMREHALRAADPFDVAVA